MKIKKKKGDKKFKDIKTISIIAHLIVSNNSIHNYQTRYIKRYMKEYNIIENYSYIENIFSKSESAIDIEESIKCFNNENYDLREELFKHLVIISGLDGNLDSREKNFLSKLKIKNQDKIILECIKIKNQYLEVFQIEDKEKRDNLDINRMKAEKIIGYVNRIRKLFKDSNIYSQEYLKLKEHNDFFNNEEINRISLEDFEIIKEIYSEILKETNKVYKNLSSSLNSKSKNNLPYENLENELNKILEYFSNNVLDKVKDMYDELNNKENSISNLTISLIGRTKAGKSTLHTVLTGEGKEAIGVGKQGTTKYNRVYQWGDLRIIDTPGIESSKEDGSIDEKIAKSVISESDIVCIVMTDDNIPPNLLRMIDDIVERNKLLYILLNHKKNIGNAGRYKLFLRDPYSWKKSKDTRGIYGHLKRINNYIESKNYQNIVKVYPLFLLAAQFAMEDYYKEDKITLIESSNIDSFKMSLKNDIRDFGTLIKSQTLLDDSIYIFKNIKSDIEFLLEDYRVIILDLKTKVKTILKKLQKGKKSLLEDIELNIKNDFNNLKSIYAVEFAEQYYNDPNVAEKWEELLKEIKFIDNLENKINIIFEDFKESVGGLVLDLLENIKLGLINMDIVYSDSIMLNIDFKRITNFALGLMKSITFIIKRSIFNPESIILNILSILNPSKSKEKKRLKAIKKLESATIESITKAEEEISEQVKLEIDKNIMRLTSKISNILNYQLDKFNKSKDSLKNIIKIYDNNIEVLNKYYGRRILAYISGEDIKEEDMDRIILSVNRNLKGQLNIKLKPKYKKIDLDSLKKQKLSNLLREKVNIWR